MQVLKKPKKKKVDPIQRNNASSEKTKEKISHQMDLSAPSYSQIQVL
jgi:hypothetical protein